MGKETDKGYTNYGEAVGVLMLDTKFPRPIGDIGNALTFNFPVRYKIISGAFQERIRKRDLSLLNPFRKAAQELEKEGVKAITTSCGFLVMFQDELSQSVDIPVFTSSLLQIPLVHKIYGRKGRIGIITANTKTLDHLHFEQAEIEGIPVAITGMEDTEEFANVILGFGSGKRRMSLDLKKCEQEVTEKAVKLIENNDDITAFVLECTNLPPYRAAIQKATAKPVFDIVTFVNYIHQTVKNLMH